MDGVAELVAVMLCYVRWCMAEADDMLNWMANIVPTGRDMEASFMGVMTLLPIAWVLGKECSGTP